MNISTGITIRNGNSPSELTEEDIEDLRIELAKVEDEIQTLRQVLLAKEKYAVDIKRQLGLSPLSNIKQNLSKGWQDIQTSSPYLTAAATLDDISHSDAYKRTQETLSHAGRATSAALSGMGVAITRRLSEMRYPLELPSNLQTHFQRALPLPGPARHSMSVPTMRHSPTLKSFEDMVGNVKEKVTGSRANDGNTSGFEKRSSRHSSRDGPF